MGNKNSGLRLYSVNKYFFREWSPNMAYILGFTCADGCVHQRTLSWELSNKFSSEKRLLQKFNAVLDSNYPIEIRKKSFRLRISNPFILQDLGKLGVIPNKTKILTFPTVPSLYTNHFIRGFLDGDGWVTLRVRKNGGKEICVGFSNGSYIFMKGLIDSLKNLLGINSFNLRRREKLTKKGDISITYQLEFYSEKANKILDFLYREICPEDLFLERKYEKAINAKEFFGEEERSKLFGRKWFETENYSGKDLKELILEYLSVDKLLPRDIAKKLNISLSTLYRWMDKTNIWVSEKRGSKAWSEKVILSRGLSHVR